MKPDKIDNTSPRCDWILVRSGSKMAGFSDDDGQTWHEGVNDNPVLAKLGGNVACQLGRFSRHRRYFDMAFDAGGYIQSSIANRLYDREVIVKVFVEKLHDFADALAAGGKYVTRPRRVISGRVTNTAFAHWPNRLTEVSDFMAEDFCPNELIGIVECSPPVDERPELGIWRSLTASLPRMEFA